VLWHHPQLRVPAHTRSPAPATMRGERGQSSRFVIGSKGTE